MKDADPVLKMPVSAIDQGALKKCGMADIYLDLRNQGYRVAVFKIEDSNYVWAEIRNSDDSLGATLTNFPVHEFSKLIISDKWEKKFLLYAL